MENTASVVRDLVLDGMSADPGPPRVIGAPDPVWAAIRALGTRLWLDTGDIASATKLWNAEFDALTTNNTLLNAEVQKGQYDDLIRSASPRLRRENPSIDAAELRLEIAFILNARHGLRLVREFGAQVSVELHTDLSGDVARSVVYGRRFHALCPDRFIVKIPLTPAGYLAARRLSLDEIPVNFTLGFSARQNLLAALLSRPQYVNVFMGRLGAFVADRKLGDGRNYGEKATLATQRALVRVRRERKVPTRLIGASMREGAQVAALAGLDVYTLPPKVAAEYRAHPRADVACRTSDDPQVGTADGVRLEDFNAASLWEIPAGFLRAVDALLERDLDALAPDELVAHFEGAGYGDLFPRWSAAELRDVAADGKIPSYERWKHALAGGSLGLDALMNISGLMSFTADQRALDDRVMSLV